MTAHGWLLAFPVLAVVTLVHVPPLVLDDDFDVTPHDLCHSMVLALVDDSHQHTAAAPHSTCHDICQRSDHDQTDVPGGIAQASVRMTSVVVNAYIAASVIDVGDSSNREEVEGSASVETETDNNLDTDRNRVNVIEICSVDAGSRTGDDKTALSHGAAVAAA